jgi:hypothetical protein
MSTTLPPPSADGEFQDEGRLPTGPSWRLDGLRRRQAARTATSVSTWLAHHGQWLAVVVVGVGQALVRFGLRPPTYLALPIAMAAVVLITWQLATRSWRFAARIVRAIVEGWREESPEQESSAPVNPDRLRAVALECVNLVDAGFDRQLDWSLESLAELDAACNSLLSDGPLSTDRLYLWWRLAGAYAGEVLLRAYGGEWVEHDRSSRAPAVAIKGITAFPFNTAHRILTGEQSKSFAAVGHGVRAVVDEHERPDRAWKR